MNYYITRTWKWQDPHGPDILAEEWRAFVTTDSELSRMDEEARYVNWKSTQSEKGGIFEWTSDGIIARGAENYWFVNKILSIADKLQAKVIDTDGKLYVSYDK